MENLINKIKQAFVNADKKSLDELVKAVVVAKQKIQDIESQEKPEGMGQIEWIRTKISRSRAVAGDFFYERRNHHDLTSQLQNKMIKKHEARNLRIANKLIAENVTDINLSDSEIVWGNDFETEWRVNDLHVSLKVIWAGGWNIQCLHPRVLCHVKRVNQRRKRNDNS